MTTFVTLILMLGLCFVVVGGVSVLLAFAHLRERRLLARMRPGPLAGWRRTSGRVAAAGRTDHGPGGRVIAPLSGAECTWYRIELRRSPSRSSDESRPGYDVVYQDASPGWPALVDDATRVLIDPRLLVKPPNDDDPPAVELMMREVGPEHAAIVPARFTTELRKNESLLLREQSLPWGRTVYALGSVHPKHDPVALAPSRSGLTVLTTDDWESVLSRRIDSVRTAWWLATRMSAWGAVIAAAATLWLWLLLR